MKDVMARLRAADPARRARWEDLDARLVGEVRDEIVAGTFAPVDVETAPARRRWRPRWVALGLAGLLVGGGVAYAAVAQRTAGAMPDGVNCVREWGYEVDVVMGSWRTGDAIADCAALMEEAGEPPIENPVAFRSGEITYVTPADEVPDGVEVLASGVAVTPGALEMRESAADFVDGGNAECRTVDEARSWARAELDRLGLDGWIVFVAENQQDDAPCTWIDAEPAGVVTIGTGAEPLDTFVSGEWPLADRMRAEITERCLPLADAARAARRAYTDSYGEDVGSLLTTIEDDSASCSRVDARIGGTVQLTVRGPGPADGAGARDG